jgi:hypothetical protein
MALLVKFALKDLNATLLRQQFDALGLPGGGLLFAGFTRLSSTRYTPNASRKVIATQTAPGGGVIEDEADPGELRFDFDPALDTNQETILDGILAAHDGAQLSDLQIAKQTDLDAVSVLVDRHQNWATLDAAQKDAVLMNLTRLVARLINRTTNI